MIRRSYHGKVGTPEYISWRGMVDRCENENHQQYDDYGGRDIRVCQRWRVSFPAFLKDMGERPPGTTLERRDNTKGYCKENCYWATRKAQCRNKRNNCLLTAFGETRTLAEWSERTGINYATILTRIRRYGWSIEEALTVSAEQKGRSKRRSCPT